MRLTDTRTGLPVAVRPGRAGLLRVRVRAGRAGRPFDLGDLRALLVGDLLLRVAETAGLQALVGWRLPEVPAAQTEALAEAAGRLGVHSPSDEDVGPADVRVLAAETDGGEQPGDPVVPRCPVSLAVGPVRPTPAAANRSGRHPLLEPAGPEPLALRLALLDRPHRAPVALTAPLLAAARAELTRWRRLVARAADSPSRPVLDEQVATAFAGFASDLDAGAALAVLRGLCTRGDLPLGAVFETFLRIDQVLALELGREIGRPPE
ncbi:hypothetical protein ACIGXM_27135 [Kitasatospora sp. NPDC052896]|uniref:hypothetical protein n=1 Tax=Kitasatospora sp. NPDC052896 TaxID=3364061 RepID=UPI0037CAC8E2